MNNILFICTQNVGRSQTAAALYNKLSKSGHADSAGTAVHDPGQTLRERALESEGARYVLAALDEEGIDLRDQARTQLTEPMLAQYDKVIVIAERDTWPAYLSRAHNLTAWTISDPRFKGLEATRHMRDEIKRQVRQLVNETAQRK